MEGYSVVVANNKAYGGGMYVAPDAELDDGEFDVVTIAKVGKLRFLGNLPKVFKGTHVDNDEVQVVRASRLSLSASRPFAVYADGEHLTDLPADLRVIPRALRVLVPPPPLERRRGDARAARGGPAFGAKRALGAGDRRGEPAQRSRRRDDAAGTGAAADGAGGDREARRGPHAAARRSSRRPTARRRRPG